MKKATIIDQITAHGAVAAHTTGKYVDIYNRVPVQVTMAQPIYMEKNKLRRGDKVAIIDTGEGHAWICTVSQASSRKSRCCHLRVQKKSSCTTRIYRFSKYNRGL